MHFPWKIPQFPTLLDNNVSHMHGFSLKLKNKNDHLKTLYIGRTREKKILELIISFPLHVIHVWRSGIYMYGHHAHNHLMFLNMHSRIVMVHVEGGWCMWRDIICDGAYGGTSCDGTCGGTLVMVHVEGHQVICACGGTSSDGACGGTSRNLCMWRDIK